MTVHQIVRYPVKGLPGVTLTEVALAPNLHLPGDRRFGFWRGKEVPEGGRSPHQRRFNFRQVADDNALAALRATGTSPANITVTAPDGSSVGVDLDTAAGKDALSEWVGAYLGLGKLPLLEVEDGSGFTDIGDTTLSLMNVNSITDLSARAGHTIEAERMRGNLYVEMPAWSELDLIGKRMTVGEVEFEVDSPVKRCVATEVNYTTGQKDHPTPQTLMKNFGHADCGIYLRTLKGGTIRNGDAVRVLG
jgi:uncharacterized protein